MWDAPTQDPLPPGRHRVRQPSRHLPRRPRPVAPARRPTTATTPAATATSPTDPSSPPHRPVSRSAPTWSAGSSAAFALAAQADAARPPVAARGTSCGRRSSSTPGPPRPPAAARWSPRSPTRSTRSRAGRTTCSSAPPRSRSPPTASAAPAGRYLARLAPASPGATSARTPTDTLNLYDTGALARRLAWPTAMAQDATRPAARRHPPRPGPRPALARSCAASGTPATTRSARRLGRRVRRQLPHLRADRHRRRSTTPLTHSRPLPALRHRAAHLAARRRPLGRDRDGRRRLVRSRTACSTRSPTCAAASTAPAGRRRRGGQRPQRAGNFEGGLGGFQTGCATARRPRAT